MAGPAETPFNALPHADSDHALPDSDIEVIAAPPAYGVLFMSRARLDLLSGLLRLHTHAPDLTVALSTASDDWQRRLVVALRLDYATDGKTTLCQPLANPSITADLGQINVPVVAPLLPDNNVRDRSCRATVCKAAIPTAASPTQIIPSPTPRPLPMTTRIPMWGLLPRRMLSALPPCAHINQHLGPRRLPARICSLRRPLGHLAPNHRATCPQRRAGALATAARPHARSPPRSQPTVRPDGSLRAVPGSQPTPSSPHALGPAGPGRAPRLASRATGGCCSEPLLRRRPG